MESQTILHSYGRICLNQRLINSNKSPLSQVMASFSLVAMLCNPFELEVNFELFSSHFAPAKLTPKHVPKLNNENEVPGSIE